MGWIPGWDSIAGTGWWASFYFWASITALMGLGVFEVISHRYSERKDDLVEIEQVATKRQHDADMARVRHETALAIEKAAQLEKDAAIARAAIANAEARASEANQKAEAERLERTRLEREIAPREASPESRKLITEELKKFTGHHVMIASYFMDSEAAVFGAQIGDALEAAGLRLSDHTMEAASTKKVLYGVHVSGTNVELVEALRGAFSRAGLAVAPASESGKAPNEFAAEADVFVGVKPRQKPK